MDSWCAGSPVPTAHKHTSILKTGCMSWLKLVIYLFFTRHFEMYSFNGILLIPHFPFSFFIVVQVQSSPFFPHHSPPPHPSPPPTLKPNPFGFVHVSFIHVPWWSFPYFPHYPSPPPRWLLSVCSLFQCLYLYFTCISVLLIRFCL